MAIIETKTRRRKSSKLANAANELSDRDRTMALEFCLGATNKQVTRKYGMSMNAVRVVRRNPKVRAYINAILAEREEEILQVKRAVDSTLVEAMSDTISAITSAVEKIVTSGKEVEHLEDLINLFEKAGDRCGFPAVKSVQSKHVEANLSDPTVQKLLVNNQNYRQNLKVVDVPLEEDKGQGFENGSQIEDCEVEVIDEATG